ncbi:MAG: glycosyltransferase family 2 protein [Cyclobacteriaceae bacterium]
MSLPKITVITPSYNQGEFLEETIQSVLNQGYPNLEYIIIDGGSTDQSVDIISKYSKELSYWVSEKDNGQSEAINKGFRRATGEIVTWLNSDDLFMPNVLNQIVEHFDDQNIVLVHGGNIHFGKGMSDSTPHFTNKPHLMSRYLSGMCFDQPASFFRKSALDKVGLLDENLHYGMDYDLFLRLLLIGDFKPIDLVVSKYRLHERSKTVSLSDRFAKDWAKVYSKFCRSYPGLAHLVDLLKRLEVYEEVDKSNFRSIEREFQLEDINKSFGFFIKHQIVSYYAQSSFDKCRELLEFLLKYDKHVFNEFKLRRLLLQVKYLPASVINLKNHLTTILR